MIETDLPLATEIIDSELEIVIAVPVNEFRRYRYNANTRELSILTIIAFISVFFYIVYLVTNII